MIFIIFPLAELSLFIWLSLVGLGCLVLSARVSLTSSSLAVDK